MTEAIQVGKLTITANQIIPLLAQYQMLPHLIRELTIDEAIKDIDINLTHEEKNLAQQHFYKQHQINSDADLQTWINRFAVTSEQLEGIITRPLKIEKFKLITWGSKVENYFVKRKSQLDRVIYSLLRTPNPEIAQELYFRIQAQETTFAEVAQQYSQGPEAQTGGLVGPVELGSLHPNLGQIFLISKPGQLWSPTKLENWFLIIRLEKFIPAQLDKAMEGRLLNELFEIWLREKITNH
jgi:parvulin-like peptidyl-prolyl isomerase